MNTRACSHIMRYVYPPNESKFRMQVPTIILLNYMICNVACTIACINVNIVMILSYIKGYLIESSCHAMLMCLTFTTPLTSKFWNWVSTWCLLQFMLFTCKVLSHVQYWVLVIVWTLIILFALRQKKHRCECDWLCCLVESSIW